MITASLAEALRQIREGVIRLRVVTETGATIGHGTGFCGTGPLGVWLVTNRHNVTGRDQITGSCLDARGALPHQLVALMPSHAGGTIEVSIPLYGADGRPEWNEHYQRGAAVDVVALPFRFDDLNVDLRLFDLATIHGYLHRDVLDPRTLQRDQHLVVVGYLGGEPDEDGLPVATFASVVEPNADDDRPLPRLRISGETGQGQSGSPVFFIDSDNVPQIAGMYMGRLTDDNVGLVWGIDDVWATVAGGYRAHSVIRRASEQPPLPHNWPLPTRISGPPLPLSDIAEKDGSRA